MIAVDAETNEYDVLIDKDGCVWVRLATDEWSYLSDLTEISWDIRPRLPEIYEPYRPLDATATRFVKANLTYNKPRDYQSRDYPNEEIS